jgi:hypothetical protein
MRKHFFVLAALLLLAACGLWGQAPAKPTQPAAPATPPTATPATMPTAAQKSAPASDQPPVPPDPWLLLRFLIGSWEAKTTGGFAQAQASGAYTFRMELRDHILARHSRSGVCAASDDVECQHSDLLYLYPEGGAAAFKAIYFDNEGHVIHYELSIPKPGTAVLLSDPSQPGPQYRLSYTLLDGTMTGQFELKMPGQSDFMSYLMWSGKRR